MHKAGSVAADVLGAGAALLGAAGSVDDGVAPFPPAGALGLVLGPAVEVLGLALGLAVEVLAGDEDSCAVEP